METIPCLEEEGILAELEKVKNEIKRTEDLIHNLVSKKRKLEETFAELKCKHNKYVEAKLFGRNWESTDYKWSIDIQNALKSVFKMDKFRPYQLAAINAVMSRQDCLLLMPTGGGKSLCYQLPAKVLEGLTLVVSPLVSLMEDQVMSLQELNFPAAMLSASISLKESREIMKAMSDKKCPFKLLYVTPEKLSKSKTFLSSLQKAYENEMFSLLAIDEVHCCSQWGHDFRTDYKILGIMKRQFPRVPILGVTATATPEILTDVKKFLALEGCLTFKVPFDRPNLNYRVFPKPSKHEEALSQLLTLLNGKFYGRSGIIYCFTVKESDQIASDLRKKGIKAASYHAQLNPAERTLTHKRWATNTIQVVVATVAFGMGIDKPDVHFVIHYTLAKSMESYYQESGRAGRDDSLAECILFYRTPDLFRLSTMLNEDRKALKKLYHMVEYCLDLSRCRRVIIAQHFDEKWDKKVCDSMCDHCEGNTSPVKKQDMTDYCSYIFSILKHCDLMKKRITAQKLISICIGKCTGSFKPPNCNVPPILNQESYERLLALMVIGEYLKESFSFTPYTTISYMEIGELYKDVPLSSLKVSFIMPETRKFVNHGSTSGKIKSPMSIKKSIKEMSDSMFEKQHATKRQKLSNCEATKKKNPQNSSIRKKNSDNEMSLLQQDLDVTKDLEMIEDYSSGEEVSFKSRKKSIRAIILSDSDSEF